MGQYYIVCNLTKKISIQPAFANWKYGEFDWEEIIKLMKWDKTDNIKAFGDYGDIVVYNGERKEHTFIDRDNVKESDYASDDCVDKYIHNITREIIDHPLSLEEYRLACDNYNKSMKEEAKH